jgi:hypothetical protein
MYVATREGLQLEEYRAGLQLEEFVYVATRAPPVRHLLPYSWGCKMSLLREKVCSWKSMEQVCNWKSSCMYLRA